MTRSAVCAASLLGAAVVLGGCGGPKVVARVNNETITEEEFRARVEQVDAAELGASAQMRGPARAGEYALHTLMTEKAVLQLAKSKGATPTDDQIAAYMAFVKRFPQAAGPSGPNPFKSEAARRRDALMQVAVRNMAAKPLNITPTEIQAEYEKAKSRLVEPKQYHLRLIEVATEAKAQAALAQIKKGISFETVALTQSEDPGARSKSGDVGFIPEPAMQPALRTAVAALKPGEYTQKPLRVEAPEGQRPPGAPASHWFLAQLVAVKDARQIPLEEVRYALESQVIQQKDPTANQRVGALVRDFVRGAKIEVTLKGYEELAKKMKEGAQAPGGPAGEPGAPPSAPPTGAADPHDHSHD